VFVYATANDVSQLPPELMRKGRFDEMFSVTLPDSEERAEIFEIHIKKRGRNEILAKMKKSTTLPLSTLVESSKGYTGAEIEASIDEAMFRAFDVGKELNAFDINDALTSMVPLSKTMSSEIKAIDNWCKTRTRPAGKAKTSDSILETGTAIN